MTDYRGKLLVANSKYGETGKDLPEDVRLIMYTSGTTGTPKGAMLSESNIISNLISVLEYFAIKETDRFLIARPLYHCAVLTGEFLVALIKGSAILFFSEPFSAYGIAQTISDWNATVVTGTPTTLSLIGQMYYRLFGKTFQGTVVASGESMYSSNAEKIMRCYENSIIYFVYGMTETATRISCLPPHLFSSHYNSVGFPLSGVRVKCVDDNGKTVPTGEEGELLVKGSNVMLGYYKDPALSQKVIEDGWLHSGDVGVIDEQGMIFIKGRKDNMINRSGINIYPQEIENAIKTSPEVEEAIVYSKRDNDFSETIVLKVVAPRLSRNDVFNICKEKLPLYQMPDQIDMVDSIPKNASGKLLRHR